MSPTRQKIQRGAPAPQTTKKNSPWIFCRRHLWVVWMGNISVISVISPETFLSFLAFLRNHFCHFCYFSQSGLRSFASSFFLLLVECGSAGDDRVIMLPTWLLCGVRNGVSLARTVTRIVSVKIATFAASILVIAERRNQETAPEMIRSPQGA